MGDPIGIILCIACFTIMNVFCEEMDKEIDKNLMSKPYLL